MNQKLLEVGLQISSLQLDCDKMTCDKMTLEVATEKEKNITTMVDLGRIRDELA